MLSRRHFPALAAALLFACLGGCNRFNYDKTVQVSGGTCRSIDIDAPRGQQQVTATFDSTAPVDVFLALEKDSQALQQALLNGKKPTGVLASKQGISRDSLEATIPAQSGYSVIVMNNGGKNADVKVVIKGR